MRGDYFEKFIYCSRQVGVSSNYTKVDMITVFQDILFDFDLDIDKPFSYPILKAKYKQNVFL